MAAPVDLLVVEFSKSIEVLDGHFVGQPLADIGELDQVGVDQKRNQVLILADFLGSVGAFADLLAKRLGFLRCHISVRTHVHAQFVLDFLYDLILLKTLFEPLRQRREEVQKHIRELFGQSLTVQNALLVL